MTANPPPSKAHLAGAAHEAARLTLGAARWSTLAYLLIMVLEAGIPAASAWLMKLLLDGIVDSAGVRILLTLTASLIAIGIAAAALPRIGAYLQAELSRRLGRAAMDRLFRATERFTGLARFEDPRFLDQLRLAQHGSDMSREFVTATFTLGTGTLSVLAFTGVLLAVSPTMTGIVLLAAVPAVVVQLRLSRRRAAMAWDLGPTDRREMFYRGLLSSIEAAKEIRLFGLGPFFRRRMLAERTLADDARRTHDRRELFWEGFLAFGSATIAGGGLLWAVFAAYQGRLSIGGIAMFVAAVAGVQAALGSIVSGISATHHNLLMFSHYVAIVRAEPDLALPAKPRPVPPLARGIELRDVWFRYSPQHPWVLRGVNLLLPHGATVALVGLNGAGKSTLVKLLCRFYDPDRGSIYWDGADLRDVTPDELRTRISGVFQDHMHYDMTAAENIGISDIRYLGDRERTSAAAARADIHGKLSGLPNGYDTLLTRIFFSEADRDDPQTGIVLSGGEWQRVALARAFLRDRRDLMILDEPSSGLDPQAEHDIHRRMREHRGSRTSLLISHRLNTLRDADIIVVLDGGVVVERGSHDELMALGGHYARLFLLQSQGFQDSHDGPLRGEEPLRDEEPLLTGEVR